MDRETAQVLLGLFSVINTALLVYQAVRLGQVHSAVNGAKDAAIDAAHSAGVMQGLITRINPVGKSPTEDQ